MHTDSIYLTCVVITFIIAIIVLFSKCNHINLDYWII